MIKKNVVILILGMFCIGCVHLEPISMKVEIISVNDDKTLVEHTNGLRRILDGDYGEPGDEITIEITKLEAGRINRDTD